jgi:Zn-dependent protease
VLIAYRLAWNTPVIDEAGGLLRGGWAPSLPAELVLSFAAGLLAFGLFNILPFPPLDGFNLLWVSMKHIGAAGERARATLVENNIGVVILLVLAFFPLNYPFVYLFLDLLAAPFLWIPG